MKMSSNTQTLVVNFCGPFYPQTMLVLRVLYLVGKNATFWANCEQTIRVTDAYPVPYVYTLFTYYIVDCAYL